MKKQIRRGRRATGATAGGSALLLVILAAAALVNGWFSGPEGNKTGGTIAAEAPLSGDVMMVEYLDVGQADASLVRLPGGETFLIDAGGNATAKELSARLKEEGVTKIDILVGTHPHEDHIGGLDQILEDFEIGALYMPRVDDSQVPTTKTYEDVLTAAAAKGLKIKTGTAGLTLFEDDGVKLTTLAPNSEKYSGLNSYSIVVRLEYGERSFLFMGDAEDDSEEEILEHSFTVQADVLKCGHHGSSTSSSRAFVQAVGPSYAVISCGKDNSYGHPHRETLTLLDELGVKVYRTDEDGTITVRCDGRSLEFATAA